MSRPRLRPVRQPRDASGRYATQEPRSVAFVVRCTAEERARWKAAAGAEGLSAKVRRLLDLERFRTPQR